MATLKFITAAFGDEVTISSTNPDAIIAVAVAASVPGEALSEENQNGVIDGLLELAEDYEYSYYVVAAQYIAMTQWMEAHDVQ